MANPSGLRMALRSASKTSHSKRNIYPETALTLSCEFRYCGSTKCRHSETETTKGLRIGKLESCNISHVFESSENKSHPRVDHRACLFRSNKCIRINYPGDPSVFFHFDHVSNWTARLNKDPSPKHDSGGNLRSSRRQMGQL